MRTTCPNQYHPSLFDHSVCVKSTQFCLGNTLIYSTKFLKFVITPLLLD
jgi:hypothetical protein